MAPPQAVAGPKPQAAAKPAANEARAPAREPSRNLPRKPRRPPTRPMPRRRPPSKKRPLRPSDSTASSADAKVADAVVDMLAMVASFNQVQQAARRRAACSRDRGCHSRARSSTHSKGKPGDGAEPVVTLDGDTVLAAVPDQAHGEGRTRHRPARARPGKPPNRRSCRSTAGDFAAQLRDTAAQAAREGTGAGRGSADQPGDPGHRLAKCTSSRQRADATA